MEHRLPGDTQLDPLHPSSTEHNSTEQKEQEVTDSLVLAAHSSRSVYLVLFFGISVASIAAILVRLVNAPSLLIAAGRTLLAGIGAYGLYQLSQFQARAQFQKALQNFQNLQDFQNLQNLQNKEVELQALKEKKLAEFTWTRKELLQAMLAGLFLASHFALWFESLNHTKIAISTVVVDMSPIWMVLLEIAILKKLPRLLTMIGIAVALGGSLLLVRILNQSSTQSVSSSFSFEDHLLGIILASVSAACVAGYFLIGKILMPSKHIWNYTYVVNLTAGISLLGVALPLYGITGIRNISAVSWGYIALLALFPSILGHSSLNYALKRVSAAAVVLVTIGEPILVTIYAYLFFREIPTIAEAGALTLILGGIIIGMIGERPSASSTGSSRRSHN